MTVICGPVTKRPRPELQLVQYVCACGYCCATSETPITTVAGRERIVTAFNRIHQERTQ